MSFNYEIFMTKVGFFTPITYGDLPKSAKEKALERYDDYFNLTGWSARVIDKESLAAKWHYKKPDFLKTALKILSYFTLVAPLFALGMKYFFRKNIQATFAEVSKKPKLPEAPLVKNQKERLIDAIEGRSFDEMFRLLAEMETNDFKIELLETAIAKLLEIDPEKALELSGKPFFCERLQASVQFKIVEAHILKGLDYKNALLSLPVSQERDALLKLAVKNGCKLKDLTVLSFLNESFKSVKVKNESLRIAFSLLSESNADIIIKEVKNVRPVDDQLVIDLMKLLIEKKAFEYAKELLKIDGLSIFTKTKLCSSLSVALVNEGKIKEAIELFRPYSGNFAAKEEVLSVMNALFEKNSYQEIVDLIVENESSLYRDDFIQAFADMLCPGIDLKNSCDYLREQISRKLSALNCEDSAQKMLSIAV